MRFSLSLVLLIACKPYASKLDDYSCDKRTCSAESWILECVSESQPDYGVIAVRSSEQGSTDVIAYEECSWSGMQEGVLFCADLKEDYKETYCDSAI